MRYVQLIEELIWDEKPNTITMRKNNAISSQLNVHPGHLRTPSTKWLVL